LATKSLRTSLEPPQWREVEEREHGAARRKRPRRERHRSSVHGDLQSINRFTGDGGPDGRTKGPLTWKPICRKGNLIANAKQPARLRIHVNHLLARVDCQGALVERIHQRAQQRIISLERAEARAGAP
jgi:hypothetical protein